MMADNDSAKKRKSVTITADDMYRVFQRYTEPTIITLYQEIAKHCAEKIDWRELVKSTSTGIKSAREYQMLWRHLAYRHPLEENIEDGAEPLDDESDLETDLEATHLGSAEVVADAQACAKGLLASRPSVDWSMPKNLAAATSIAADENLTNAVLKRSHNVVSQPGTNSGLHNFSQRRPSLVHQSINDQVATGGNPLAKKKKYMRASEHDMMPIAGVKKYVAGNMATVSREHYNGERNDAQVGSRRKQFKDKNYPGLNSTRSDEQVTVATREALEKALNKRVTLTACSAGKGLSSQFTQSITSAPLKDQTLLTKPPVSVKPSTSASSLKEAAVAAGARIVTPEAAESILKAAHANNAIHIMHGGGPNPKPGSYGLLSTTSLGAPHHGGMGLAASATTLSNSSAVVSSVLETGSQCNAISSIAADKPPSESNTEAVIRSKKVVDGTCSALKIKEQNEQVQDQHCVGNKSK